MRGILRLNAGSDSVEPLTSKIRESSFRELTVTITITITTTITITITSTSTTIIVYASCPARACQGREESTEISGALARGSARDKAREVGKQRYPLLAGVFGLGALGCFGFSGFSV